MATIIRVGGAREALEPEEDDGSLSTRQIQAAVGGPFKVVEQAPDKDYFASRASRVWLVHEDGPSLYPPNAVASLLAGLPLHGDVVQCTRREADRTPEAESWRTALADTMVIPVMTPGEAPVGFPAIAAASPEDASPTFAWKEPGDSDGMPDYISEADEFVDLQFIPLPGRVFALGTARLTDAHAHDLGLELDPTDGQDGAGWYETWLCAFVPAFDLSQKAWAALRAASDAGLEIGREPKWYDASRLVRRAHCASWAEASQFQSGLRAALDADTFAWLLGLVTDQPE